MKKICLLPAAVLAALSAEVEASGQSWLRDYRDARTLTERAFSSSSDIGMRQVSAIALQLARTTETAVPEDARKLCFFAADWMKSVARSLSTGDLMSAQREHRQWKAVDARCERAITGQR